MKKSLIALIPLAALALAGCKKDELQAELDRVNAELTKTRTQLSAEELAKNNLAAENQTLQERIAQLEAEIGQLMSQIGDLANKAGVTEAELAELRVEKAKREAELEVYRNLFASLKKMVDAGTIKVGFRKGRLVVKLEEAILFDSGRAALKDGGKTALGDLVVPLRDVKRDWIVAGHTDIVPIRTARFRNNWDLSVARSVEVVNFLIEQGMPAEHVGAAGYAEFDPVADNSTDEGKAQNRRIEIMLMPTIPQSLQNVLQPGN
jgi:chemotaxis protein MotB